MSGAASAILYDSPPTTADRKSRQTASRTSVRPRSINFFRKTQKYPVTTRVTPLKHVGKTRETPHPELLYPLGN